jgi:hypothetical protein
MSANVPETGKILSLWAHSNSFFSYKFGRKATPEGL